MSRRNDEIYRPKSRSRLVPGPNESLRRRVWLRGGGHIAGAMRGAAARIAVRAPPTYSRRCLVQASYVRDGRIVAGKAIDLRASADDHLDYIEREGVERDGSAGRLYSASPAAEPERRADEVRASLREALEGEEHQFRFIVSPEDAGELDLNDYVRELMARVERDLGQPLIWGAVNHYNTAHPHAHVVVRGIDRAGRPVRFDPEYIKRGFRARAEELATEWLGPRTEHERRQQLEREVHQQRYTTLDRGIAAKARDGVVRHTDLSTPQQDRVQVLEALGLAERRPQGAWRLRDDWIRSLRRMGERGDVIKQMHQRLRVDRSRFVICGGDVPLNPIEGERFHGRIAHLGLRDNVPDGMYALVETARSSGYWVPLSPSQASTLREGDLVTLRRWTDREGRGRLALDRSRLRLAQQVAYVGPTWLDEVAPSGVGAFARELGEAQSERAAFLGGRGLSKDDLRAAERRRLTEHYAHQLGLERAQRLDGFVGSVRNIHEVAHGPGFAVVANDDEVVLLRATKELRGLVGREVHVSFDGASSREAATAQNQKRSRRLQVQALEHER